MQLFNFKTVIFKLKANRNIELLLLLSLLLLAFQP